MEQRGRVDRPTETTSDLDENEDEFAWHVS